MRSPRTLLVLVILLSYSLASGRSHRHEARNIDFARAIPATLVPTNDGQLAAASTKTISNVAQPNHNVSLVQNNTEPQLSPTSDASNEQDGQINAIAPLTPSITPALSVAGVFLMISGVIYTLIGIKNRSIQVFFSTSYLVGLAITVLVLYLINPPISKAIQGAYFVAVFIPATIVGGLAILFKDMLEGTAAAVGGFALAMFILVLRDGGLLQTMVPKAIFIACFTLGTYALHFSRHVRTQVIIGSTALAGSTGVVLGIDCFSCAGLKEFWVYIWALNSNLLSVDQTTYQITRGMIVEIVAIVVITFFGVLSQVRIWKVVKRQKDLRDQARCDEERQREDLEAELGRIVEETQVREKRDWDRMYSDDNNVATEPKRSTSFSTRGPTDADTIGLQSHGSVLQSPNLTHPQTIEEEITPADSDGTNPFSITNPNSSTRTSLTIPDGPDVVESPDEAGPKTGILPFTVQPELQSENQEDNDSVAASIHTHEESKRWSPPNKFMKDVAKRLKRFSMLSMTSVDVAVDENETTAKHLSYYLPTPIQGSPFDGLSINEENEGRILMPQASLDSIRASSPGILPIEDCYPMVNEQTSPVIRIIDSEGEESMPPTEKLTVAKPISDKDCTETTSIVVPVENAEEDLSLELPGIEDREKHDSDKSTQAEKILRNDKLPDPSSEVQSRSEPLPQEEKVKTVSTFEPSLGERPSQIMLRYRTNEWAKHLSNAEEPEQEDVKTLEPHADEPAVIVNENELLQTPTKNTNVTPPASESRASISPETATTSEATYSTPKARRLSGSSLQEGKPVRQVVRSPSGSSLTSLAGNLPRHSHTKKGSQRNLHPAFRNSTNSILASPIDEDTVASFPTKPAPAFRTGLNRTHRSSIDSTLIAAIHHRQSRSSLKDIQNSSQQNSLSDDTMSLSARRHVLRKSSSGSLTNNDRSPSRESTASPPPREVKQQSRQLTYPQTQIPMAKSQYTVPEHTLRRASMLAEWRRSNPMELNNLSRSSSPTIVANYPPLDQGSGFASLDQAATWSSNSNQAAETFGRMSVGSQGMIGSSIYGHDSKSRSSLVGIQRQGSPVSRQTSPIPRQTSPILRQSSPLSARDMDNAHRDVLRRMQAGANRALKDTT